MPSLPKPRFGRSARARGQVVAAPPEPEQANPEVVEHGGLRWINIERPRAIDRAWLEERFEFHVLDYEDVFSRNQRPKVDEYDDYLFERCRSNEELRDELFSKGPGYLLYKIVDDCVDASFPMLRKIGNKLERIEEDIFEGKSAEVVRDISNAKQEIINFRKVIRPQRAAFSDLERNKQRYIADDLDIYFDDIVDASERIWDMLENFKEVVEALE